MPEHRQVRYSERMRLKGFFRAQLWIPSDETELFQDLATVARDQPLLWPDLRREVAKLLEQYGKRSAD